ncbi:MAG: Fe-S cluster assembly ATPase SufC [Bacilli bacterium]
MKSMLIIKDLTVYANEKLVLNKLNLTINDGETHVIMGPNGAGKSTLTKVVLGDSNYKVTSGDIIYNGKSILNYTTDERARLGIFLAMQLPLEIDGVTNSDFLRTALSAKENKNVNLYEFIKKIDEASSELLIPSSMIHRSVNKGFSGGEKKKNEILQMKILEPKMVLLDEIDSGLDVDSLKIVAGNIDNYKKKNKDVSILMITHYTHLLKYVKPDYVHVLSNGAIIQSGNYLLAQKIEENGFDFAKIVRDKSFNGTGIVKEGLKYE